MSQSVNEIKYQKEKHGVLSLFFGCELGTNGHRGETELTSMFWRSKVKATVSKVEIHTGLDSFLKSDLISMKMQYRSIEMDDIIDI